MQNIPQSAKLVQVGIHLERGGGAELWGLLWTHVSIYAGCLYSTCDLLLEQVKYCQLHHAHIRR